MAATYESGPETSPQKSKSITAHVTDDFHRRFAAKAAEVPGRTSGELARELLERHVFEEPAHVTLLAELLAFRRLFVRSFLVPEADMTLQANALRLIAETDASKLEKALARLRLTQPADGAQP